MNDAVTYRAKACQLRARAEASGAAAEVANYLELARAWDQLAKAAAGRIAPEPRALDS